MTTPNFMVQTQSTAATKLEALRPSRSLLAVETIESLRLAAIATDAHASAKISLRPLWHDLSRGRYSVAEDFFSDERCYLILTHRSAPGGQPLEGRRLEILEAVLSGRLQKNVAIDLQLAPSTVALNSRLALESMGLTCKPSRAHPLLMLAAKAASENQPTLARCSKFATNNHGELLVISATRPDLRLAGVLPSAELAVIRRLVEGLSYAEIARRRGTSTRTIANQITAVFRRLRVSGRNELVQRMFADEMPSGMGSDQSGQHAIVKGGPTAPDPLTPEARQSWSAARRSA